MNIRFKRTKGSVLLACLAAAGLVVGTAVAVPIALAGHDPGNEVPLANNPKCADVAPGTTEFKIDDNELASGTHTDNETGYSVDLTLNDDDTFDWEANKSTQFVIAKGGNQGANGYDYRPDGAFSDSGLHAPENPSGKPAELSHVTFCYDDDGGPGDDPECSDGADNDGDGFTDYPDDPGCEGPDDDSESPDPSDDPECSDGVDNDGDGHTDYPDDPDCDGPDDDNESPDPSEDPECSDGADNDGDGHTDFPDDPGCDSEDDDSESPNPQCSDGDDNDGDGKVDEADPGCHDDGDPDNPDSYDPRDDDETDETNGGGDGTFSCRASTLRLESSEVLGAILGDPFEPFVANADGDPCVTEDGSSPIQGEQDFDFASGSLKIAYATTDDSNGADANAGVAHLFLAGDPGFIEATVLDAHGEGRCEGGQPVLTGGSTVATLNLNGEEIVLPPDNEPVEIPLGPLATLYLNWSETVQTEDGEVATFRALYLDAGELEPATGDVIVGEAIVDYSGNPCGSS